MESLLKKPEEREESPPVEPEAPSLSEPAEKTAILSTEEIPLTIIVEVDRIQMPIKKLLELQPGNVLELAAKPESAVSLVINGKCVGKGELLRVGDTLGVRIIDLG